MSYFGILTFARHKGIGSLFLYAGVVISLCSFAYIRWYYIRKEQIISKPLYETEKVPDKAWEVEVDRIDQSVTAVLRSI